MLITEQGQMIRISVSGIRAISRNTQGVRLIALAEGDKLVSATPVEPEDDEEIEELEESAEPVVSVNPPPAGADDADAGERTEPQA